MVLKSGKPKIKISEANVKKAVFAYLQIKGYLFWPINNVGIWDADKGIYRRSGTLRPGVSDAMVLVKGKLWALEFKSSTGPLSEAQKEFQRGIEANGGIYLVVRSIDDLQKASL